ncbi:MAG: hypothetical protein H6607_05115 [Flavobacteriales bacterium]|nr:hypothetical protein [Flavobacteriales bacterium]
MKQLFENMESKNTPSWNKEKVWSDIEKNTISKKKKGIVVPLWLSGLAAACLVFALFLGYRIGGNTMQKTVEYVSIKDTVYVAQKTVDTFFKDKIIESEKLVFTTKIQTDTLFVSPATIVKFDTIELIKTVYVKTEDSSINSIKTNEKIKYAFHPKMGEIKAENRVEIKLFNNDYSRGSVGVKQPMLTAIK